MELLREAKSKAIGNRLYSERLKFELKAQKLRALQEARKQEMNVIFEAKFELAELQKKLLHLKAANERKIKVRV